MPKTKRNVLKKNTANAISYTLDAVNWLTRLYDEFIPTHPDHAEYLQLMGTLLLQVNEMLHDFWRKTWGPGEVNWEAWATVRPAFRENSTTKEIYAKKAE